MQLSLPSKELPQLPSTDAYTLLLQSTEIVYYRCETVGSYVRRCCRVHIMEPPPFSPAYSGARMYIPLQIRYYCSTSSYYYRGVMLAFDVGRFLSVSGDRSRVAPSCSFARHTAAAAVVLMATPQQSRVRPRTHGRGRSARRPSIA